MAKQMKQKILSMLLLMCILLKPFYTMAADNRLGEIIDGSVLTDEKEAESISYPRLRGSFLNNGICSISNEGNRTVNVTGSTTCYTTCDKVKVYLYLERLVGKNWQSYKIVDPAIAENDYHVSKSKNYSVDGGYYYRVTSTHVAVKGKQVETLGGETSGIWID